MTNLQKRLASALRELHALVWGECPSLLNEDSGGCARLDIEIEDVLREHDASASAQGLHIEVGGISDGEIVVLRPIVLGQDGTWTHLPQYNARNGECVDLADVLRMLTAAPVSAQGDWQLVPKEPTNGMLKALTASWGTTDEAKFAKWVLGSFVEDYKAMLAAAPAAPTTAKG